MPVQSWVFTLKTYSSDLARLSPHLRSKIRVDSTGCWLWTAGLNMGYGRYHVRECGKSVKKYAHRITFEETFGPIPPGLQIDHVCRVRRCVNPFHLRAVTQKENILAPGSLCQSKIYVERTHCQRGHRFTDADYRTTHGYRFRRCRQCHRTEERERARTKLDIHIEDLS